MAVPAHEVRADQRPAIADFARPGVRLEAGRCGGGGASIAAVGGYCRRSLTLGGWAAVKFSCGCHLRSIYGAPPGGKHAGGKKDGCALRL